MCLLLARRWHFVQAPNAHSARPRKLSGNLPLMIVDNRAQGCHSERM